jgi:hypothetical protein
MNHPLFLNVYSCFPFLLSWVISWWQGNQIALAMDATALSLDFTVLSISVVYRGCAIPVAWTITKGNAKGQWNKHWLRMLHLLKDSIPQDYLVIVLTDRGLYSPKLFSGIRKSGWHPFMRLNACGTFRPDNTKVFRPIPSFASKPGEYWCGTGIAFKTRPMSATVVAVWQEGYEEAWYILTDLPPQACDACWYGMRAWIEQGFRTIKRGGLHWNQTRITDPQRAQRLWLGMSVALIWLMSVGGEADASITESTIADIVDCLEQTCSGKTRKRLVSVFRRGWVKLLVVLIRHEPLPFGRFIPEPWPIFSNKPLPNKELGVAA